MMNIVFLHGLLGTQEDWSKISELLPHFHCITLDLPFHGSAKLTEVKSFDNTASYLSKQIKIAVGHQPYMIVGYSLGGRIALYYALQAQCAKGNLQGLILEGVNLGLTDDNARKVRWENDKFWAQRFMDEPIENVLNDWYQQPVFAHLTEMQRAALIAKRAANCGENIGKMLQATSLAKQPYLGDKLRECELPVYYLVGEKDRKFRELARQEKLNMIVINQAGHNAHLENPQEYAKVIAKLIS
ncbi:2-succinyl-6-hydroxy-2,4-cyclohexadiene-1-carboxylate synthase [Mannheimia massilioguelmaensis]|uniref:2-succinyl-6-hydroxy-2, 4-cyclohexadiene-1-carboxylate synthase n=1 Tax=Mannheimia massilioguelmaensis TaxID=1604354 RepID=UPI0005CA275A|nr:2-succinyl-6-hydroxy-2,4-cyclohexadiene-1-carboxylate synthase [Mannheimia massilioguelmaensis]